MKFKYTDILIVENILAGDIDVVEAPYSRVSVGDLVTYGSGLMGKVISRHWVGSNEEEDSTYALAKALAAPLYTITGYATMKEVVVSEDP